MPIQDVPSATHGSHMRACLANPRTHHIVRICRAFPNSGLSEVGGSHNAGARSGLKPAAGYAEKNGDPKWNPPGPRTTSARPNVIGWKRLAPFATAIRLGPPLPT